MGDIIQVSITCTFRVFYDIIFFSFWMNGARAERGFSCKLVSLLMYRSK